MRKRIKKEEKKRVEFGLTCEFKKLFINVE